MMYYIYTDTYAYIISVITVLSGTVYGLYVVIHINNVVTYGQNALRPYSHE